MNVAPGLYLPLRYPLARGTRARTPRFCRWQERKPAARVHAEGGCKPPESPRRVPRRILDLLQIVVVSDGITDMADFAAFDEPGQHIRTSCLRNQHRPTNGIAADRRNRPQRAERFIQLLLHISRRAWFRAIQIAVILVPELGGQDPVRPRALDGRTDERFGKVIAIALGRVDQIQSQFLAAGEHRFTSACWEFFSPFATELPGADADDRNAKIGFAESAVCMTNNRRETRMTKFEIRINVQKFEGTNDETKSRQIAFVSSFEHSFEFRVSSFEFSRQ